MYSGIRREIKLVWAIVSITFCQYQLDSREL